MYGKPLESCESRRSRTRSKVLSLGYEVFPLILLGGDLFFMMLCCELLLPSEAASDLQAVWCSPALVSSTVSLLEPSRPSAESRLP